MDQGKVEVDKFNSFFLDPSVQYRGYLSMSPMWIILTMRKIFDLSEAFGRIVTQSLPLQLPSMYLTCFGLRLRLE